MTTQPFRVKSAPEEKPPKLPSGLAEKLMYFAIVLMPFQQAFTIPVGFPLKFSEIFGALALILFLVERRTTVHRFAGAGLLAVFALLLTASTIVNLIEPLAPYPFDGYERGLTFDILQYFGLGAFVLLLAWQAGTRLGPDWIARGVNIAIKLAALYCFVQLALGLVGQAQLLAAVQGVTQVGTTFGTSVVRNGPFLEGNLLGFFAGLALFTGMRLKDRVAVWTAIATLLFSQSTSAYLSLAAGGLLLLVVRPSTRVATAGGALGFLAIATYTFVPAVSRFVNMQLGKLGLGDTNGFSANIEFSMRARSTNIETGFGIASQNPFVGVGPGRYGYWYRDHTDFSDLPVGFALALKRPLANNAYVQIMSELGFFAAIVFVIFLVYLLWRVRRSDRSYLAMGIFVVVALNTSPAWTFIPIWIAIAYLASVKADVVVDPEPLRRKPGLQAKYRPLVRPVRR
ncbi:O-antigen ligase family protein [Pseudoclavibacter helvolus]|uniref:O-antigen ligase family protein n=1 Tax=Pseudoclavibacter helvolus TaxID=255205 RepID=UPI003C76DB11